MVQLEDSPWHQKYTEQGLRVLNFIRGTYELPTVLKDLAIKIGDEIEEGSVRIIPMDLNQGSGAHIIYGKLKEPALARTTSGDLALRAMYPMMASPEELTPEEQALSIHDRLNVHNRFRRRGLEVLEVISDNLLFPDLIPFALNVELGIIKNPRIIPGDVALADKKGTRPANPCHFVYGELDEGQRYLKFIKREVAFYQIPIIDDFFQADEKSSLGYSDVMDL